MRTLKKVLIGIFLAAFSTTCLATVSNNSGKVSYVGVTSQNITQNLPSNIVTDNYKRSVTIVPTLNITNGLIVDTSTLYINSSLNRVGILTTTPAYTLSVNGIIKSSQQIRSASNRETLSGNKTIAATDPQYQFLNPNGANRDVTLPSATQEMFFVIKNTGSAGNTLTVKDSGGTAVTGGTIANNVAMGFYYDGTAWQLL